MAEKSEWGDGHGTRADLIKENNHLKEQVEKLRSQLAGSVHEINCVKRAHEDEVRSLRQQVCEHGERAEKAEKLLMERNRQYQEDCITINRLHVAVETLAERLAAHMRT